MAPVPPGVLGGSTRVEGFRGLDLRIEGLGFRLQGLGFRGLRVRGLGV